MAKYPAAYSHRINKVTISGTCFNASEEWSTGFYLGSEDADAPDPGTATASALAPLWTTFFTSANSKISTAYKTTAIKVSQLDTDGDVDLEMINMYDYTTPPVGVNGGAPFPPQIALAATLTSQYQRGLASKGRMYLPGVNVQLGTSDAHMSSTEQGTIANQLKTFFDAVNADTTIGGYVILASKGHKVKETPPSTLYHYVLGRNARVTGLRVGNVYDTQRRRRGAIEEAYTSRVLA